MSTIRVVTMRFGDLPYFTPAAEILEAYCKKFSYDLVVVGKEMRDDRHGAWSKVMGIKKALEGADFVFYIDADAIIIDHGTPLSMFERAMRPEHLILLGQGHIPGMPNTGTMLVRNSHETAAVLARWNKSSEEGDYAFKYPWDEGGFQASVMREYRTCVSMPGKGVLNWVDGKFIRHYMGGDTRPESKLKSIQGERDRLFAKG